MIMTRSLLMAWVISNLLLGLYKVMSLFRNRSRWPLSIAKAMCYSSIIFSLFCIVFFALVESGYGLDDVAETKVIAICFIVFVALSAQVVVVYCGWFSLLVCSLCMVVSKRAVLVWNLVTSLCMLIALALGLTFALLGVDSFQDVMLNLSKQFVLASVIFFAAALVILACFSAIYWRFFRCGRKIAPLFIFKLKRLWITSAILFLSLVFGGLSQSLWDASRVKYHSAAHEVMWTLLVSSYLLSHMSILLMISTRNPSRNSSSRSRPSPPRKSSSLASLSSASASSARYSINDLEGSAPFTCPLSYAGESADEADDDDPSWADPFGSLPKRDHNLGVDTRPLLSS